MAINLITARIAFNAYKEGLDGPAIQERFGHCVSTFRPYWRRMGLIPAETRPKAGALTDEDKETIERMMDEYPAKYIASELGIKTQTVHNHASRIRAERRKQFQEAQEMEEAIR
jgi:hypothetical protein